MSTLQNWVVRLSGGERAVVLGVLRRSYETRSRVEKELLDFARESVLNVEVDEESALLIECGPSFDIADLASMPLRSFQDLLHAFEVIAYRHPDADRGAYGWMVYRGLVESLHLTVEQKPAMIARLSDQ